MIGNDVVDLIVARKESNWQRKGFLEKLFTGNERNIIYKHTDPEKMVWILWSMKEAAYKIYNRQTKFRGFIPQQLQCSITTTTNTIITGGIECNGFVYYSETTLNGDLVHTIALINKERGCNIYELESPEIIKDIFGIPWIYSIGNILKPVSISHHGRFFKIVSLN